MSTFAENILSFLRENKIEKFLGENDKSQISKLLY